jgi:glycine cleavage system aminomethyltransferase T
LNKPDFVGRDALLKAKTEGPRRRLCCFLLEEPASVYGGEAIWRDGTLLGVTSSGGYGYTVGKSIVYGYVPAEHAAYDTYEIETFGRRVPARRSPRAPYDPERRKILA